MPRALNETSAVHTTAASERHNPNPPPDIGAEQFEWARSAAELLASDSDLRCHESQTDLASANPLAFLKQLSESIAEINQPISAVVMNAEAALRRLVAQPTDTEAIRRLLACIVKDGMRTAEIANTTRTLTDRKRADERLRASEQRLLDVQIELGRVTRMTMLGEITASIANEANQSIAAVIANAETCLNWLRCGTPHTEAACRSMQWIIDDGNRAGELIRRVRSLANKTGREKVPLEVNDLLREAILLMRQELINHQVSLRMNIAAAVPMVLGDRIELQQVIINLVMNGIEALQSVTDRPRQLVVRSGQDEIGQALISVADCGIGIAAENVDQLFEPFFTTKSDGMGMGLPICRSIIQAHGGRLWAAANVPHGAVFQFTLPACMDSAS
jgi:C4-dicarboxylate-specific signal transduction histidine kinase